MHTHPFARMVISFVAFIAIAATSDHSSRGADPVSDKEKELLEVLRSDAPKVEKAVTCKLLAIHGTSESVPELAMLLPDPQLSSWARIALEAIPGETADEALRKAAESLDGLLLVGTINSIGVRRDADAVVLLSDRLQDKDVEIASAAAVALGQIGNAAATTVLRQTLANAPAGVRSAVAEGCVLCAERLYAAGDSKTAVEIYDEVRSSELPKQRIIEATRGSILARGNEGIPLLIEQFRSSDNSFFQLALSTAREFPGEQVDKALAEELSRTAAPRAALVIQAMADRPKTVVLAAILEAASHSDQQVRLSAINALGRVGDASCLATLLDAASETDAAIADTAKATLAALPSEKIDSQIIALLPEANGRQYQLLLDLVGQRRIDAVPELLKGLKHSDSAVRGSALKALGETVSIARVDVLISAAVLPTHPEDADAAQQALRAASVRMPDREACAGKLGAALELAPPAKKTMLLEIVSEVGGPTALTILAGAAKSGDPQLQDDGSRLLGKWNGVDAAPVLLDLAKTGPGEKYRIRALRGYIGLARKFSMPEADRAQMCQNAMDIAGQPAEKKLVLDVLQLHPSVPALALSIKAMQDTGVKDEATQAVLVIAQKIGDKVDVSEQLAQARLDKVKLEIVKAEYGAGSTQKDVTSILRKHAGDLPLIMLPSANYNASFGGDPVPGSVKQLKVQFRINGKPGEATFAENALIVFSTSGR